ALDRTPTQLDVLADAGVVDAGGRGLLVLLDTLAATLTGHAPRRRLLGRQVHRASRGPAAQASPRFEVMYLLSECDAENVEKLRARLDELGDSVAIA
ncbi:dihydroxyacetone kinase, partial [Mycobacterium sp. ITM-2017-0098]